MTVVNYLDVIRHEANDHLGRIGVVTVLNEFGQRNVRAPDQPFTKLA